MAQHKKFWLMIAAFFLAIVAYSGWIYHTNNMQPVSFAGQIDEFQKSGVPNFALPILDGASGAATGKFLKSANLEDQVVVINFWASWCAPCKVEFPSLVDLARKYESSAQKLRVVAISVDTDVAALNDFLTEYKTTDKQPLPTNFEVLADAEGTTAKRFGTKKLPESYIIDKDHKLLRKVIDQQNWVSPEFLSVLEKFMSSAK